MRCLSENNAEGDKNNNQRPLAFRRATGPFEGKENHNSRIDVHPFCVKRCPSSLTVFGSSSPKLSLVCPGKDTAPAEQIIIADTAVKPAFVERPSGSGVTLPSLFHAVDSTNARAGTGIAAVTGTEIATGCGMPSPSPSQSLSSAQGGFLNTFEPCNATEKSNDYDSDDDRLLCSRLGKKLISKKLTKEATEKSNDYESDDDRLLCSRLSKKLKKEACLIQNADIFGTLTNVQQTGLTESSNHSEEDKPSTLVLQSEPKSVLNVGGNNGFVAANLFNLDESFKDNQSLEGGVTGTEIKVYSRKRKRILKPETGDMDGLVSVNVTVPVRQGDFTAAAEGRDDTDEDDIPLARHIPAVNKLRKTLIAKRSSIISIKAKKLDLSTGSATDYKDEDDIPLAYGALSIRKSAFAKKFKITKLSRNSKNAIAFKKVSDAKRTKVQGRKKKKDGQLALSEVGVQKWTTLEHHGVIFPPLYKSHGVKMLYDGQPVDLTAEQEEVATMFAVMRDTEYVTKPKFLQNFWTDWKKFLGDNHVIKKLEKCDFSPIYNWHLMEKEKKQQLSSEEKKILKEEKLKQEEKYMWACVDGLKEKVGNFRVEPPGLFRGRGDHPKMGKWKRRIFPEDVTINVGEGAPAPECPMPDHRWKEIMHDNTVTWLAFWNDPINTRDSKYVFLAPSSTLKGQSDKSKYEKARLLKDYIQNIRETYSRGFYSDDPTVRQIAVATYLIDKFALRAGNEKEDDEADTVGCCSLKIDNVTLIPPTSLQFDFLGKDSIRYFNVVEVLEPVYTAIGDFMKSKEAGQDLFDKLDTSKLNAHLKGIMPGLTAKVFRTYNASITLQNLIVKTIGTGVPEKLASYHGANKEVAILCNHQRSVSKSHDAQMERLEGKMSELEALLQDLEIDLDKARKGKQPLKDSEGKIKRSQMPEILEKKIAQTNQRIHRMKLAMQVKDDLKTVALGTSKINYMDPRITVAWCKRHEVPIEKIFNKSLLAKFVWAMDVEAEYHF